MKIIAYRAETTMANILCGPTISLSEARVILRNLYNNEADIIPDQDRKILRVVIHGAATAAANRAILRLLEHLNKTETEYPGTNLRLWYECAIPPPSNLKKVPP